MMQPDMLLDDLQELAEACLPYVWADVGRVWNGALWRQRTADLHRHKIVEHRNGYTIQWGTGYRGE